jgi:2-oxoglutarate ferredoxin oxidoreductase subunit delta
MIAFKIDQALCKGCGLCINACPKKLLAYTDVVTAKGYRQIRMTDVSACIGCASCARTCPDSCIEIWRE